MGKKYDISTKDDQILDVASVPGVNGKIYFDGFVGFDPGVLDKEIFQLDQIAK